MNNIENKEMPNMEKKIEKVANNDLTKSRTTISEKPNRSTNYNQRRNSRPRRRFQQNSEYQEKIIDIARVTNVVKGGRRFSFSAFVVIGNKKGKVGFGHGKSLEVPDAIKKAIRNAQKNIIEVPIVERRTIPHEDNVKYRASKILIKPAPRGKGIIASGTVRSVIELAGYRDIYTKTYGSRNKVNIAQATINVLKKLRTAKEIAILRNKEINEII